MPKKLDRGEGLRSVAYLELAGRRAARQALDGRVDDVEIDDQQGRAVFVGEPLGADLPQDQMTAGIALR